MAIDPAQLSGLAPPQGVTNTQTMAPPIVPPGQPPMPPGQQPPPGPQMPPGQPMPQNGQQQPPQQQKPKSYSLIPYDLSVALAKNLNDKKMEVAKAASAFLGDPKGTVHTGIPDMLRVWRSCNKKVDPLFEKLVNHKSDEEITNMMFPLRMPYIRYTRRTYTEQVQFAEYMAKIDQDPKYASIQGYTLDTTDDPEADFPHPDVQRKRIRAKIRADERPEPGDAGLGESEG